ncbi:MULTISPECIES: MFS transporter [Subtercola]|uniref:DHA2 family efflux MFS transporter permease subunit n=1 Tax=Subtercola vilae TaxID=2056433 RepID=A0A4T2C5A8_9MICO|nr:MULTISPECIES: MFS transporter [Subtercola]MEA9984199.1 MFS transporter [Subtercola sp. RTI3]TIH37418.1 DHA2 family efflux MFS transporter permease subunit [Subtercola vilae]
MRRSPWSTLVVLAIAQFMVVLDVTIVNVALPRMQTDLGFAPDDLQWVISAYTLIFGGFLLLGGRSADLVGRRRIFVAGLVVFALSSLAAGVATSPLELILFRGVQGLGGAMLSASALTLLMVTFEHGRRRTIALGVWGGLAGLGGTMGAIVGGVLVDNLSWRWVFLVNVPIGIVVIAATFFIIRESRAIISGRRTFDVAGAVLSTTGLLAIMLGVIRAEPLGWGSIEVIGLLAGGVLLLAAFVLVESRSAAPLIPLRLFRTRSLSLSVVALGLNSAGFLAMFFLTAIFLQQVRGLSAFDTGLAFLPMGIAAIVGAVVASRFVTMFGTRAVQVVAAVISVIGLLLLSTADASSPYASSLLPGLILFGLGITAMGVPAQVAAQSKVRTDDAGAASGVLNAGYQVGGALGLAVITTLATAHITDAMTGGTAPLAAAVGGFQFGLLIAAIFAAVNIVIALLSPSVTVDSATATEAAELEPVAI